MPAAAVHRRQANEDRSRSPEQPGDGANDNTSRRTRHDDGEERHLDEDKLAYLHGPAAAELAGPGAVRGDRPDPLPAAAAGVRRRDPRPQGHARQGGPGRGLPAPGRRLLRGVLPLHRPQHPRDPQGAAADGGHPHLRRQQAGDQGGPYRRPVRQAALKRHRDGQRRGDAQ